MTDSMVVMMAYLLQWYLFYTHSTEGYWQVDSTLYEAFPSIVAYIVIYGLWAEYNIKWYLQNDI